MTDLEDSTRIIVPKQVVAKEVGGEMVLLDLERGSYFKLNVTAAALWRTMAAGQTLGEGVRQLGERFEAPEETLRREMALLLEDLMKERLVHLAPA